MTNRSNYQAIKYTEKKLTHTYGASLVIKHNIKHKNYDDYISDILAAKLEVNTGNCIIATLYQPPARRYISIPDLFQIFRSHTSLFNSWP